MLISKPVATPMMRQIKLETSHNNEIYLTLYRRAIGSLMHLNLGTRPVYVGESATGAISPPELLQQQVLNPYFLPP